MEPAEIERPDGKSALNEVEITPEVKEVNKDPENTPLEAVEEKPAKVKNKRKKRKKKVGPEFDLKNMYLQQIQAAYESSNDESKLR